jgi:hypothetical protein
MKVFAVGSKGQLGLTLAETVPGAVDFAGADLPDLDITDLRALAARLAAEQPDFVVNAAAYPPSTRPSPSSTLRGILTSTVHETSPRRPVKPGPELSISLRISFSTARKARRMTR